MKINWQAPTAALVLMSGMALSTEKAIAADGKNVFGIDTASVTYGPYARIQFGGIAQSFGDAYWLPPGYPDDPKIEFNLGDQNAGFAELAVGYDWMNGFRADLSLSLADRSDLAGPCASASNNSPCSDHADITGGSVRTTAIMGNLFYAPLERRGSSARFQPFIVGGLGIASNSVGDWTRVNVGKDKGPRTFFGDKTSDLAWSLGFGMSYQLTKPGQHPVILEASYRYYDFGTAKGSSTPTGAGGVPVEPLTFNNTGQVVSVGLRIPLQKY